MQKFQCCFFKILYGISKGLDSNLVTTKIKKAIEVDPNEKEVDKEILTTFEIKEEVEKIPFTIIGSI